MIYVEIQDALQNLVNEALSDTAVKVIGENDRGKATVGETWAQCTLLPAMTRRVELGLNGRSEYSGLFQVNFFLPAQTGSAAGNEYADKLAMAVKDSPTIDVGDFSVHLLTVSRQPPRQETDWYMIPVRLEWRAYA